MGARSIVVPLVLALFLGAQPRPVTGFTSLCRSTYPGEGMQCRSAARALFLCYRDGGGACQPCRAALAWDNRLALIGARNPLLDTQTQPHWTPRCSVTIGRMGGPRSTSTACPTTGACSVAPAWKRATSWRWRATRPIYPSDTLCPPWSSLQPRATARQSARPT